MPSIPDGDPTTDDGADIINMSLGTSYLDQELNDAVDTAFASGALVVVAAGNDYGYQSINSPGSAEHALTVGATDKSDNAASFTSKGPVPNATYIKPEISAPGDWINSLIPNQGYGYKSGTSMAAPHVAGAAALLKQAFPALGPGQLKSRLISGSTMLEVEPYVVGVGRLNIMQSIENKVIAHETSILLGNVDKSQDTWSTSTVIHLTNTSEIEQNLNIEISGQQSFVTVDAESGSILIPAGDTVSLPISISIDTSAITYTGTGVGAYHFRILLSNDSNNLAIPLVYEYNNTVHITQDGNVGIFTVYSGSSQFSDSLGVWILNGDNTTIKLPHEQVSFLFDVNPKGSHLDESSNDASTETLRVGFVIMEDVELNEGLNLWVGQDSLDYRLTTQQVMRDGAEIEFDNLEKQDSNLNIYHGDNPFYYSVNWLFCADDCTQTPIEAYINQAASQIRVETVDRFIGNNGQGQKDYISFAQQYSDIKSSELKVADLPSEAITAEYDWPEFDSVGLQFGSTMNTGLPTIQKINIYRSGENSLQPFERLQIYEDDPDRFWSLRIADTGRLNRTEDGSIKKYQYADSWFEEIETYYQEAELDTSLTTSLRYWTASTSSSNGTSVAIKRHSGVATDNSDHAFVRDIRGNSYYNEFGIAVTECDGTKTDLSDALFEKDWHQYFEWFLPLGTCDQVEISYGLGAGNSKGQVLYKTSGISYAYPELSGLQLRNNGALSESITDEDNALSFKISSSDNEIAGISVAIRKYHHGGNEDDWQEVYQGVGIGEHSFSFTIPNTQQLMSLKIEAQTGSGNEFTNIIPGAFTLGVQDTDADGIPDHLDNDDDNDGVADNEDLFPLDPNESSDYDLDGIGNNADLDDDNDGVVDTEDAFPLDETETRDTDNDGIGDNRDEDRDNDGFANEVDCAPQDDKRQTDCAVFAFDYNGDGKADIALRDPSNYYQYFLHSSNPASERVLFGRNATDIPVSGDFDGDSIVDIAVRRPESQIWYIRNSSGIDLITGNEDGITRKRFGSRIGDIPVPADYDGDGITDLAVRRPSTHYWYILNSSGVDPIDNHPDGISRVRFGSRDEDIPVPADYDGDGRADIAVRRPSTHMWYILNSSGIDPLANNPDAITRKRFGTRDLDIPVVADYDGDGRDDMAVYRPATQMWYVYNSSSQDLRTGKTDGISRFRVYNSQTEDTPVVADYDGDGLADFAIRRPSNGKWYINPSSDPAMDETGESKFNVFDLGGNNTDIPLQTPVMLKIQMLENTGS